MTCQLKFVMNSFEKINGFKFKSLLIKTAMTFQKKAYMYVTMP